MYCSCVYTLPSSSTKHNLYITPAPLSAQGVRQSVAKGTLHACCCCCCCRYPCCPQHRLPQAAAAPSAFRGSALRADVAPKPSRDDMSDLSEDDDVHEDQVRRQQRRLMTDTD